MKYLLYVLLVVDTRNTVMNKIGILSVVRKATVCQEKF